MTQRKIKKSTRGGGSQPKVPPRYRLTKAIRVTGMAESLKRPVVGRLAPRALDLLSIKRQRLPIQGLRSLREADLSKTIKRGRIKNVSKTGLRVRALAPRSGDRSICHPRSERRRALFATKIAGRNRRNSPGSGPMGSRYKVTPESLLTCKRRK